MRQIIFVMLLVVTGCGNAMPASELASQAPIMPIYDAPQGQRVTRGMLFRGSTCCQHRAQAVAVRVTHPQYGPSSFAYTGQDGMYYLYNVPAGKFTLEIWITNDERSVQRYPVTISDALVNDIPPIRVP